MSTLKIEKTVNKKKPVKTSWHELTEEKDEFKNIVGILNRYYREGRLDSTKTSAQLFREELVESKNESLRIFMKKFGKFELLIVVEIETKNGKKMDSWIHIDGIAQEKEIMKEQGRSDHPVFNIVGLLDLFNRSTKEVQKGFEPAVG